MEIALAIYLAVGSVLAVLCVLAGWSGGFLRLVWRDYAMAAFVCVIVAAIWLPLVFVLGIAWLRGSRFD